MLSPHGLLWLNLTVLQHNTNNRSLLQGALLQEWCFSTESYCGITPPTEPSDATPLVLGQMPMHTIDKAACEAAHTTSSMYSLV